MASTIVNVQEPPVQPVQPRQAFIQYAYYVSKWRQRTGYMWDNVTGIPGPAVPISINDWPYNIILLTIDPLTAISMGMVTPGQLNYPPGILAAFNLLSKEPS